MLNINDQIIITSATFEVKDNNRMCILIYKRL